MADKRSKNYAKRKGKPDFENPVEARRMHDLIMDVAGEVKRSVVLFKRDDGNIEELNTGRTIRIKYRDQLGLD